ncbi:MAG: hypothetical protein ABI376_04585 [Caulobacteraceae bacterium]
MNGAFRNAGFVACLVGVLTMLTGRFVGGAPAVLAYVGVSIVAVGWGLFALALFTRSPRKPREP